MENQFEIGIIGAGVAGCFASLKIAQQYPDVKTILFEQGRPPLKRRAQLCSWGGSLIFSDGKIFTSDLQNLSAITTSKRISSAKKYFHSYISQVLPKETLKLIEDSKPIPSLENAITQKGFDISYNDYIQLYPKDIHALSKHMSSIVIDSKNITTSFDNEIYNITKENNEFVIYSEKGKYICKKVIIATGRSGWRWTKKLYDSFGLIEENDYAKFGIRIEIAETSMKDFNRSNCKLKRDKLEVGQFSWNGSVIPEDHLDFAISAFRSNEGRWQSDNVSFNLISERYFKNAGLEQTDRIGQLTFILTNERIAKEKISNIFSKKSKLSIIPEYNWLENSIEELTDFVPDLKTKGYFHFPTILPLVPKIKIGNNFLTENDGMYAVGEAAGSVGIYFAILSGIIAAGEVCR
jgi:uncharacterized FAD-dependent dehydrogenase